MAEENKKMTKMTLDKLALMIGRGFNAVDGRLDKVDASLVVLEVDMKEVKGDIAATKTGIRELINTLDAFLKRLTDREEEFTILKREMGLVKKILKEKLQIDVDALK
jgi:uncharacterized protein YunC (DUF1805 family)